MDLKEILLENNQPLYGGFGSNEEKNCELEFNKKSVNYDMSEIELPAYCKNHPDGKLLYIITPEGQESELGCAHCALNINKNNLRCQVVEVKEQLRDYIGHADYLLGADSNSENMTDPSLAMKINAFKDREIALVRQYYDRVMDALSQEKDKHIREIEEI